MPLLLLVNDGMMTSPIYDDTTNEYEMFTVLAPLKIQCNVFVFVAPKYK